MEDVQNGKVELKEIDAIVCAYPNKELKKEEIKEMKKLRFVFCAFAGIDHIPKGLFNLDINIIGNSGGYSIAIAEHVFAMVLSLAKNLYINNEKPKKGIFDQSIKNTLLFNKICGIIGFGGIGKEVAKIARAFSMKVYAINSTGKLERFLI